MRELLLPVEQVVDLISINPNLIFANHDNYQFVELAQDCRKKINKLGKVKIKNFYLVSGKHKYVLGTDGRNMSSRNGNEIYLFADIEELKAVTNSIRTNLVSSEKRCLENNPIFQYCDILGFQLGADFVDEYLSGQFGDKKIKERFFGKLIKLQGELKKQFLDEKSIGMLLEEGEALVAERVINISKMLTAGG